MVMVSFTLCLQWGPCTLPCYLLDGTCMRQCTSKWIDAVSFLGKTLKYLWVSLVHPSWVIFSIIWAICMVNSFPFSQLCMLVYQVHDKLVSFSSLLGCWPEAFWGNNKNCLCNCGSKENSGYFELFPFIFPHGTQLLFSNLSIYIYLFIYSIYIIMAYRWSIDVGWASVWVKISSEWIAGAVYS